MERKEQSESRLAEVRSLSMSSIALPLHPLTVVIALQLEDEILRLRQVNRDLSALYLALLEKSMRTPSVNIPSGQLSKETEAEHRTKSEQLRRTEPKPLMRNSIRTALGKEESEKYSEQMSDSTGPPVSHATPSVVTQCTRADCARQLSILKDTNNDLRLELVEQRVLHEAQLESLRADLAQQQHLACVHTATKPPSTSYRSQASLALLVVLPSSFYVYISS